MRRFLARGRALTRRNPGQWESAGRDPGRETQQRYFPLTRNPASLVREPGRILQISERRQNCRPWRLDSMFMKGVATKAAGGLTSTNYNDSISGIQFFRQLALFLSRRPAKRIILPFQVGVFI